MALRGTLIKITMKKNSSFVILFASAFLLSACGGDSGPSSEPSKPTPSTPVSTSVKVESVSMNVTSLDLYEGDVHTVAVTITPSNASEKAYTFSSSDSNVATIDDTGKIMAISAGETTISVTTKDGNKNATCIVVVKESLIDFADKFVKQVCVSKYDLNGDGELSKKEASQVKAINKNFFSDYKDNVKSFDEFQYFTSVTEIPYEAFSGSSLSSIILPSSIVKIGAESFGFVKLSEVNLNDGLKIIGDFAFQFCNNLTTIKLPSSLEEIGKNAFQGTELLDEIEIPSSIKKIPEGLLAGSGIKKVILNPGLETISDHAFGGCFNLTEISIPNTVKEIGNGILYGCNNLSLIDSHYSIEEGRCLVDAGILKAFAPNGLSDYEISEEISAIGERVFMGITDMQKLTIPRTVVSIGSQAFGWNTGLKSLIVEGTEPPILQDDTFVDNTLESYNISEIRVPYESVESYKTAAGWSRFASIIKPIDKSQYMRVIAKGKSLNQYGETTTLVFHSRIDNPQEYVFNVNSVTMVNEKGEIVQIKNVSEGLSNSYVEFDPIIDNAHSGSNLIDYYSKWSVAYEIGIEGNNYTIIGPLQANLWGGL